MKIVFAFLCFLGFATAEEMPIEAFWVGKGYLENAKWGLGSVITGGRSAGIGEERAFQRREDLIGESRFLRESDTLWDVSGVYQEYEVSHGEGWIVYNETTGFLVAKAHDLTMAVLDYLHRPDRAPFIIEAEFALFDVACGETGYVDWRTGLETADKQELGSHECAARVGETAKMSLTLEDGSAVKIEFQPNVGIRTELIDLRIEASFKTRSGEFKTEFGSSCRTGFADYLELGSPTAGRTTLLRVTPHVRLVGGPRFQDWRQLESEDDFESTEELDVVSGEFSPPRPLKDEGDYKMAFWLSSLDFVEDLAVAMGAPDTGESVDPFSGEGLGKSDEKVREGLKLDLSLFSREQTPSTQLDAEFPGELWWNLSNQFSQAGVSFGEEGFVVVGLKRGVLVAKVPGPSYLDLVDAILRGLLIDEPRNLITTVSLSREREGNSEVFQRYRSVCRSGEKAQVGCKAGKYTAEIEVQPNIGASNALIDLRYSCEIAVRNVGEFSVQSGLDMRVGSPQRILLREADGESLYLNFDIRIADDRGRLLVPE